MGERVSNPGRIERDSCICCIDKCAKGSPRSVGQLVRGNSRKSYYAPVRPGFQTDIRSKLSNRLFAEIERNSENVCFPDGILKLRSEFHSVRHSVGAVTLTGL